MNEFDQFIKHQLKQKYYIRYADDFVFMHQDRLALLEIFSIIQRFLTQELKLLLHSDKIFLQPVSSGVDFLGWVHFLDHRVLRTSTKRRMFRNLQLARDNEEVLQSYLGLVRNLTSGGDRYIMTR